MGISILGGKALANRTPYLRWLIFLLLAMFLANAANKFFVGDLAYEIENGFYYRIFNFEGDAPDQYRILPLLPIKWLSRQFTFNISVLIYNTFFSFLVFEGFWLLMGKLRAGRKYAVITIFAMLYIYCQYTGWRPDTMGLLAVVTALMLVADKLKRGLLRNALLLILLTALIFCRAEIALAFAFYLAIYQVKSWPLRVVMLLMPLAGQALLQLAIFPEAAYYSKKIMIGDNFSFYYILRHPASYLMAAVVLAFWGTIKKFVQQSFARYRYVWLLLIGYICLVLVVGRINEYRLYLPFVPLFLWMAREMKRTSNEEESPGPV